jgi:hypothetical protein
MRRHIVRLLIVFAGWIATTMLYYGLSLNASNLGNKYKLLILSLHQQKLKLKLFTRKGCCFPNSFLSLFPFGQTPEKDSLK